MRIKNLKLSGIKNIVFDLGNVLLDIDISLTVRAFDKLGLTRFNPADIHPNNSGIFLDLELGRVSNQEFFKKIQAISPDGEKIEESQIIAAWNALLLPPDYLRYDLVEQLSRNYRIFLLSNTNLPHRESFIPQFNKRNPSGKAFESYFEQCFYSDQMHLRKPDPQIYHQMLKSAGIRAEETFFIDDNKPNLVTAREIGIHTHHLVAPETVFDLFSKKSNQ